MTSKKTYNHLSVLMNVDKTNIYTSINQLAIQYYV